MMSWICSECGCECSPSELDCPTCAGRPIPAAAPREVILVAIIPEQQSATTEQLSQPEQACVTAVKAVPEQEIAPEKPPITPEHSAESVPQQTADTPGDLDQPEQNPVALPTVEPDPQQKLICAAAEQHLLPRPLAALEFAPEQSLDPTPQVEIPQIPVLSIPLQPPALESPAADTVLRHKAGVPAWVITAVAAVVVTFVLAAIVQKLKSGEFAAQAVTVAADAKRPASPARVQARSHEAAIQGPSLETSAPGPPLVAAILPAAVTEHPYARFVEVISLKVVEQNERPQVQYFVVNNAGMEVDNIVLRISVRSSTSTPGTNPLFTVTAWVPKLGPHQSKEIRTDLDTGLRASQIPRAAHLRTEVRVTSQQ